MVYIHTMEIHFAKSANFNGTMFLLLPVSVSQTLLLASSPISDPSGKPFSQTPSEIIFPHGWTNIIRI